MSEYKSKANSYYQRISRIFALLSGGWLHLCFTGSEDALSNCLVNDDFDKKAKLADLLWKDKIIKLILLKMKLMAI